MSNCREQQSQKINDEIDDDIENFIVPDKEAEVFEKHGDEEFVPDESTIPSNTLSNTLDEGKASASEEEDKEGIEESKDENAGIEVVADKHEPYNFRESTQRIMEEEEHGKKLYANPLLQDEEGDVGEAGEDKENDERSIDRRVVSLVSGSHRKGRSADEKRSSAEKASELYEKMTGHPLEINESGEVVTGPPVEE